MSLHTLISLLPYAIDDYHKTTLVHKLTTQSIDLQAEKKKSNTKKKKIDWVGWVGSTWQDLLAKQVGPVVLGYPTHKRVVFEFRVLTCLSNRVGFGHVGQSLSVDGWDNIASLVSWVLGIGLQKHVYTMENKIFKRRSKFMKNRWRTMLFWN
jgi:hypothetical protein